MSSFNAASDAPPDTPRRALDAAEQGRSARSIDADAVKSLKARDNTTNWFHLAQIYFVIVATIAGAIWATGWLAAQGYGWGWTVLVNTVAVLILGATQHQFGGAVHEGTHFLLFADRRLNEIASDWLAAFPIYTSTYQFRLHHLAHHQFVNDPERDPDIAQLKESGHWLDFPIPPIELLWAFLKRLSPIRLLLFTVFRAKYSAVGFDGHVYMESGDQGSKWPLRVGILYAVAAPIACAELIRFGYPWEGCIVLAASTVFAIVYLLLAPERAFTQTRLAPVISHRATMLSRIVYFALLYGTLTALTVTGAVPGAWRYFNLYWVIPLFTSFPLFMMVRQWVQHGNADRGRYTNTRVFLTNPLVRYSVFPWGMDYHLPHHLMASVPHYNLKRLHEHLLEDETYREKGVVLQGFLFSSEGTSALEALGPAHVKAEREKAYVDNAALEYAEVSEGTSIAAEAARSEQAGT